MTLTATPLSQHAKGRWLDDVSKAPRSLLLACLALDVAALAIDVALPAEYGIAPLYIGATLLAFWLPWRRATLVLAVVGTACAVFGYVVSPLSPAFGTLETVASRVIAVLVMWWATGLALAHQEFRAALEQSEAGLAANEARLQSILETVPEALITINQQGIIGSFSRSAELLFGYDAQEILGRNVSGLMPTPHQERHNQYLERYLQTGERRIIGIGRVVEGKRKDGSVFPMELAVGEARVNQHRIFTGFVRDLTARQKIEQELRQAQKMEAVGQLTGGIAHDFNNLLTVILGNLEMLQGRLRGAKQRELLVEAQEAATLGAQLTQRLLAFGRRQPLNPKKTNIAQLVFEFSELLRRTIGEIIDVSTATIGGRKDALVDPSQLQNALLNLALNARDAMPNGGRLSIEISEETIDVDYAQLYPEVRTGRYVAISVTDTGTGMSKGVQERAFEPFFTTKAVGSGTGLGLSMVYGFVKQSAGHVQIYSEPGHGTTVRIYLPIARDEDSRQAPTEPAPADPLAKGETVLVVEDDPRVRRVTVARLRELGYAVCEADSGPAALATLSKGQSFDLLFTDMVMPGGLTGVELAERVRSEQPHMKVLFTSGYAEPETIKQGQGAAAQWLRKPYTRTDLARKLREVLD